MEYQIVTALSTDALARAVNDLLVDEWEPLGGPYCFRVNERGRINRDYVIHAQAMIRGEEPSD